MDITKLLALITAIRARDWPKIGQLTGEILVALLGQLTSQAPQAPALSAMNLSSSPVSTKSVDELTNDLEAVCQQRAPKGGGSMPIPVQGPIIDALKPLLAKLILMLLGIG